MIKNLIRRRRLISVLAAVMSVITIASAVFTYMFTPFLLTKEQALDNFYIREDGAVVIDYSPYVSGRLMSGNGENWYIHQYSTRYDIWAGENRKTIEEIYGTDGVITDEERLRYEGIELYRGMWQSQENNVKSDEPIPWAEDNIQVSGGSDWNWWYADPTGLGRDLLLHDAGKLYPDHHGMFSPVYPVIFFGGILAGLFLMLAGKKLRKPVVKEVSVRLSILTVSAAAATLLVSSGRILTVTVGIIDQYWNWMIPMNTVFLTFTGLLWRQMYLLNRQDRGI